MIENEKEVSIVSYLIETNSLTKLYQDKLAVDHVNMHVKKGEIYGFVGPNGSGKSTILKMMLNLIDRTSGSVYLFGRELHSNDYEVLKRIGSIIENPYFYDNLTAKENLSIHAKYIGLHDETSVTDALKMVKMTDCASKKVKQFSLGMKQRLAIARAIMTKPELLLLDEPINALDPEGIREMRALFKMMNSEWGTTIIISSHILSEVELIADSIGVIKNGTLLKEISMPEVHEICSDYFDIVVDDTKHAALLLEEKLDITNYVIHDKNRMRIFDLSRKGSELSLAFISGGVSLEQIQKSATTLEDYFFQLTEGGI